MEMEKNIDNVKQVVGEEKDYQEVVFMKVKQLGKVTTKRTETNVKVFSNKMKIHQDISGFLKKKETVEKEILLNTIKKAEISTVWDFWDSIYTVICVVLGFVSAPIFLLALICAFCAYGKEIEITLVDGTAFNIPCSGQKGVDVLPFKMQEGKTKFFKK